MTLVYVTVLSIELFVLERLLRVSALRIELLQQGNLTIAFLEHEITQIPSKDFHKRFMRSFKPRAQAVQGPAQNAVKECLGDEVKTRDELEDLERQYLGR
jgi:hypothetical protein